MKPIEKLNYDIWLVLQTIQYQLLKNPNNFVLYYEDSLDKLGIGRMPYINQLSILRLLAKQGIITILDKKSLARGETNMSEYLAQKAITGRDLDFEFIEVNEQKFNDAYKEYRDINQPQDIIKSDSKEINNHLDNEFAVSVKDREIWINNYLLKKPYSGWTNLEFFEYIRSNPKMPIKRKDLPDNFEDLSLKKQVGDKNFISILNNLGFKGEILKAFFADRGVHRITYRGDRVTKTDLDKAGVNVEILIRELELAHLKNSPK